MIEDLCKQIRPKRHSRCLSRRLMWLNVRITPAEQRKLAAQCFIKAFTVEQVLSNN